MPRRYDDFDPLPPPGDDLEALLGDLDTILSEPLELPDLGDLLADLDAILSAPLRDVFGEARSSPKHARDPRGCGACTRKGAPCRARALENGRCRHHGGLSTGAKSPEGRARSRANLKQYRDR
jgi:hypothetical protein